MSTKKQSTKQASPLAQKPSNKDRFGVRKGSMGAKLVALLTGEPQTMATLKKAAGARSGSYHLLTRLEKRGLVSKDDKGFRLTAAGLKLRK